MTSTPLPTLASHLTSLLDPNASLYSRKNLTTHVLPAVLAAIAAIAPALARAPAVAAAGTANPFGDAQLNVDVLAEDLLRATLAARLPPGVVVTASSEEDPVEKPLVSGDREGHKDEDEHYTIAFDPLDGSSIIAPNWTVGTILGIWDGSSAVGAPAARQVAAVLGVYGPKAIAIAAVRVPGTTVSTCFEVSLLDPDFPVLRSDVQLRPPPFATRYFAPANLRAAGQDPKYLALVNRYIADGYTLRYSGGLVPDVVHALVKGHGIYVSPVTAQSKAKLRRLYELFPLALIVECAGGTAIDPVDGSRILDAVLENTDERAGLVCGTAEEVELVKKALVG